MSNKIAVLGSGMVGDVLANGFLKHGYEVMRATREISKLDAWRASSGPKAQVGSYAAAAKWADRIVLAVKGTVAESVLEQVGIASLAGKTILDTTNPIADAPPVNGVLRFFTDINESLMERLQSKVPEAHFVKVFSCVGNAFMVNPQFPGGPPTMFICGNDAGAKAQVKIILEQFGWDIADMGTVEAARAIEPLCLLWCIPGLSQGSWTHAFKLLRL
jgi:predicted dinucleotide-binding enzyme